MNDHEQSNRSEGGHAAHELIGPTYAHAILATGELIAALPSA
jgi:hypothetical protein